MLRRCVVTVLAVLAACAFCQGCGKPGTGPNAREKGVSLLCAGRLQDAVKQLETVVAAAPDDGLSHAYLGAAYWQLEEWPKAAKAFGKAAKLLPSDPRPLEFVADIHIRSGRWDAAWEALSEALRRAPDNPRVLAAAGVVRLESGQMSEAVSCLQAAINADPEYAPALYNMAFLHYKWSGNATKSRDFFQRYLKVAEDRVHADRAQRAVEALRLRGGAPIGSQPDAGMRQTAAEADIKLGIEHSKNSEWDDAVAHFQKALANAGTNATASYNMGIAYQARGRAGDFERAEVALRDSLRTDPGRANARYTLAFVLWRRKNAVEAVKELERLLRDDPGYAEAHYLLGNIYARSDGRPDLAESHYRSYIELAPDSPRARSARAWVEKRRAGIGRE